MRRRERSVRVKNSGNRGRSEGTEPGSVLCCLTPMNLRRLLAALVLLMLIPGHSLVARICVGADCSTSGMVSAANGGAGFGGADMARCTVACSTVPAAVGFASARVLLLDAGLPLESAALTTRSFSRPPDTAPPKVLSA